MSCKVGSLNVSDIMVGSVKVSMVMQNGVTLWEGIKPWCQGVWTISGAQFVWSSTNSRFDYGSDYLEYDSTNSRWHFHNSQVSTSDKDLYVNGTGREKSITFSSAVTTGLTYTFTWSKTA